VTNRTADLRKDLREVYQHSPPGASTDAGAHIDISTYQRFPVGEAPEFPTGALPRSVARLVKEGAAAIGCPEDFIGLSALTTLGAAIGNARVIQPKKGWTEGASLYAAVIADPGEKKTPALAEAISPAQKLENRLNKEYERALEEFANKQREYEVELRDAKKQGRAAYAPPERPTAERVYVNDTTIEALIPILKGNPRGLLLERDELVGWVKSMDQYRSGGKGADRQFWLSGWSNRPVSVDRKGQQGEPLSVLRPFVSVIGAIQPTVLPELAEGREDGMLERFLFAYPESVNAPWMEDEISEAAEVGYRDLYHKLRGLSLDTDELGDPVEKPVAFSPDAKQVFIEGYNAHRTEMAAPGFPPHLRSPWAKLEAYLLRFALIMACCRFVEEGVAERVESDDVLRAMVLLDYFKAQARRVFGALYAIDPRRQLLADVVRFVKEQGGVWTGSPRELHDQLESPYKPKRENELSKFIPEGWDEESGLLCEKGQESYKDEEDGKWKARRVLTLYLQNR
jgi:putative DNA primase/helicase